MRNLIFNCGATMLLVATMTLTGCGNIDNPLEEIQGGSSSTPKSSGSISYATTELLRGSKDPSFTNALTLTGDGTVSYASSNTSVATVDANGKVTPVAPGTVTITTTVSDSESYTYSTKQATYTIELQDGYSYREWNTTTKKYDTQIALSADCEVITSATTTLDGSKQYLAIGNVDIANSIQVTGDSRIILCDNAELNINGRLYGSSQLTINAQSEDDEMGNLNVTTGSGTDDHQGVIHFPTALYIHGGKITAIATGSTYILRGIHGNIYIYGGYIKGQGNVLTSETGEGNHGISGTIEIYGGKVEGIGGNSTSNTKMAGNGIHGKLKLDGDAIVIATGGNGVNVKGGYGFSTNTLPGVAQGNAKMTATGGNSENTTGGIGMNLQGDMEVKGNAQIIATGGNNTGTGNEYGGEGSHKGNLTIRDQASITIRGGKSSGAQSAGVGMNSYLYYYGGAITIFGGTKGPTSPSENGRAVSSEKNIYNKTAEKITFEYCDDSETWVSTFDIDGNDHIGGPTHHGIRKIN